MNLRFWILLFIRSSNQLGGFNICFILEQSPTLIHNIKQVLCLVYVDCRFVQTITRLFTTPYFSMLSYFVPPWPCHHPVTVVYPSDAEEHAGWAAAGSSNAVSDFTLLSLSLPLPLFLSLSIHFSPYFSFSSWLCPTYLTKFHISGPHPTPTLPRSPDKTASRGMWLSIIWHR